MGIVIMIRSIIYYYRTLGWRGVASALRAKRRHSTLLLEVNQRGIKAPFYLRMPSADIKVYEKVFLDKEYAFHIAASPRVIIDAGAHIGLASIAFANSFPEARIIAVEPESRNYDVLRKNVAPYKNVIAIQAALWSESREIVVLDPAGGNWGFMTCDMDNNPGHPLACVQNNVPGITVHKLMEQFRLDEIDILKMDIEGAEREVFRDASSWIGKVNCLVVELHERLKPGCNRIFYTSTNGFGDEWEQGENVILSKGGCVLRPPRLAMSAGTG